MKKITEGKDFGLLVNKAYKYRFEHRNWSDWGLLFRFLIVICKLLDKDQPTKTKKARKISAWSLFLGEKLRAGMTIQEAGQLWKEQKQSSMSHTNAKIQ